MVARFSSSGASASSQVIRVRGVIRLSVLRSPRSRTRFIILRSSASITPCSWLSLTSRRISSSLTADASVLSSRSSFSSPRIEAVSSHTAGRAIQATQCIGTATAVARRSGASSARRLGSNSPSTMLR